MPIDWHNTPKSWTDLSRGVAEECQHNETNTKDVGNELSSKADQHRRRNLPNFLFILLLLLIYYLYPNFFIIFNQSLNSELDCFEVYCYFPSHRFDLILFSCRPHIVVLFKAFNQQSIESREELRKCLNCVFKRSNYFGIRLNKIITKYRLNDKQRMSNPFRLEIEKKRITQKYCALYLTRLHTEMRLKAKSWMLFVLQLNRNTIELCGLATFVLELVCDTT